MKRIETENIDTKEQREKINKSWEACGKLRNAFKIIDAKFLL